MLNVTHTPFPNKANTFATINALKKLGIPAQPNYRTNRPELQKNFTPSAQQIQVLKKYGLWPLSALNGKHFK